eukprot:6182720-Pleurochrysis_carterae.AAC.1
MSSVLGSWRYAYNAKMCRIGLRLIRARGWHLACVETRCRAMSLWCAELGTYSTSERRQRRCGDTVTGRKHPWPLRRCVTYLPNRQA